MGDLIEGIGDEVLLFVAFLAISMAFLFYVSFLRGGRAPARGTEQPSPPAPPPQSPAREEPAVPTPGPSRETTGPHDGLRHRTRANIPPNDTERSPESPPQDSSHEGGRGTTTPTPAGDAGGGEFTIKLVQAGGPERTQEVPVSPNTTLDFLRRTYFRVEVAEFRPVKFIYQGRVLENDATTLRDLNITHGGAMHVHVGRPRPPGAPPPDQGPEFLDLSQFFVPLFGVMLGVAWVCMLLYPYVFTFISKLFLFLLSTAYVILAYLSTYGR